MWPGSHLPEGLKLRVISCAIRQKIFTVVSLEQGGKSPVLVFDDAVIEGAVNGIIAGNFGATGQSCVAGSRVFIQSGIREQVLEKLAKNSGPIARAVSIRFSITLGPRQSGSILRANRWQIPSSCVNCSAQRFSYPAIKSNQQDPGYLQCRLRDETYAFSYR